MTQEEKAMAYDEALLRAKEMIRDMTDIGGVAKVDDILHIFPELKESEDEKIMKNIVEAVEFHKDFTQSRKEEIYAWLKKQCKHNHTNWNSEDEEHLNSVLERLEGMCKKGSTFIQTRFAVSEDKDWLKSLRVKFNWKPSDEQLRPLGYAIDYFKKKKNDTTYLESLYNDLENLQR